MITQFLINISHIDTHPSHFIVIRKTSHFLLIKIPPYHILFFSSEFLIPILYFFCPLLFTSLKNYLQVFQLYFIKNIN